MLLNFLMASIVICELILQAIFYKLESIPVTSLNTCVILKSSSLLHVIKNDSMRCLRGHSAISLPEFLFHINLSCYGSRIITGLKFYTLLVTQILSCWCMKMKRVKH